MPRDPQSDPPDNLSRAVEVGRDAALVGFDWDRPTQALEKVAEEVSEVRDALAGDDHDAIVEEVGDLLFAVCNVARKANVDPEKALGKAIEKFERRFRRVVATVESRGQVPGELSLAELEQIWQSVK